MAENNPQNSAGYMFKFLGDMWSLLPAKDKRILANFWDALVKRGGHNLLRAYELDLSVTVKDMPVNLTIIGFSMIIAGLLLFYLLFNAILIYMILFAMIGWALFGIGMYFKIRYKAE